MNNPLFKDKINDDIIDFSEEFKNRTLYFQLKNNLTNLLVKVTDNYEFRYFLQSTKKHNQIKIIVQFYEEYQNNTLRLKCIYDFIDELISANIGKIIKLGYVDIDDYNRLIKKYDFNKTLKHLKKDFKEIEKSDLEYYGRLSSSSIDDLEGIENYEKIINDFSFLKRNILLDYSDNINKININIEYLVAFYKNLESDLVKNEDIIFLYGLKNISQIYFNIDNINTLIIKKITSLVKHLLGLKLSKSGLFLLTIYNRLVIEKYIDKGRIISSYNNLISEGYISKKIKNIFIINSKEIYNTNEFIFLWLNNVIIIIDDYGTKKMAFVGGIYEELLSNNQKKVFKEYNNTNHLEIISNNLSDRVLEDYKIDVVKRFLETGNVNKKNIKYTVKQVKEYKSLANEILGDENLEFDDNIYGFLLEFFDFSVHLDNYNVLLEPLYLASKKLITSNIYNGDSHILPDNFNVIWKEFQNKYKGKTISIDEFIVDIFEKDMEIYVFFDYIKSDILSMIGRKIDMNNMGKYLLSEEQLFKRLLVYLARIGYVDILGKTEVKEITYFSGDSYQYGYSGLSRKYINIDIFEPKYIRFKDTQTDINISKENYISGNEIYLRLDINDEIIKSFSKFTKLEKIEKYIVLNMSRDTLIKAKNEYGLGEEYILSVFKKLKLDISRNIEILIKSVLNQKIDLSILPVGIPVILENIGIFNEFLKLKLFNKYILYSNEELKLIVFDIRFKGLEKTLNNRKILYKKEF